MKSFLPTHDLSDALLTDPTLSLEFFYHKISGGQNDLRHVALFQPNPQKGSFVEEGDQSYVQGSTKVLRGSNFAGRDVMEAYNTLLAKISGEEVSSIERVTFCEEERVHGYSEPRGGLDSWMFEGYRMKVQQEGDALQATMYAQPHLKEVTISEYAVKTVDDAVNLYEQNPVSPSILQTLMKGIYAKDRLRSIGKNHQLPFPEETLPHFGQNITTAYDQAMKALAPLNPVWQLAGEWILGRVIEIAYIGNHEAE